MEEEEDIMRATEDDDEEDNSSSSGNEADEPTVPLDKDEDELVLSQRIPAASPASGGQCVPFALLLGLVVVSSALLVILLPLYLETAEAGGCDAYSVLLFTTGNACLLLGVATALARRLGLSAALGRQRRLLELPLAAGRLAKLCLVYYASGFLVVLAVDRRKVMCHLQDPIKGIVLVFSLVFYFFCCQKMMGLQRIFSSTTIIVGLFISVDYGLCDEFRCRGQDREAKKDDGGHWSLQVHAAWAAAYILGLALFSAHFTLLERYLVPAQNELFYSSLAGNWLATISRAVSTRDTTASADQGRPLVPVASARQRSSSLHLCLWIHLVGAVITLACFWVEAIPTAAKSTSLAANWSNRTMAIASQYDLTATSRRHVSMYAYLFLLCYVTYAVASVKFLMVTQSAVFTVAASTASLPLSGIWWSIFKATTVSNGVIAWSPSVTGELICSLLGLPIVLLGVLLLCKSHLQERARSPSPSPLALQRRPDFKL